STVCPGATRRIHATLLDAGKKITDIVVGCRARLIIIVDYVDHRRFVASVHRAMAPIKHHVITEIEWPGHSDGRIAGGIARKKVMMEGGGIAAPRATESVSTGVQRFTGNRPLDGDVLCRIFNLFGSIQRRPHMPV